MVQPANPMAPVGGRTTKTKGWRGSIDLKTGTNTNESISPQPLLQQNFAQADIFTLEFSVTKPAVGGASVLAFISWSVEGITVRRVINVGNGVSISGTGQAVNVTVADVTVLDASQASSSYTVTATLSQAPRATTGLPVTVTNASFTLGASPILIVNAAGGQVTIPVPPNCGILSVELALATSSNNAIPNVECNQQSGPTIFKIYRVPANPTFVALIPNADTLVVTNFDPAHAAFLSVTWGVDG